VITFTAAVVPVLVGLTFAETNSWIDPEVLVSFAIGAVFLLIFLVVESRVSDPMIPLDLFRNRTFAVSAVATFFSVFGFSTLIIFLPLWFQIVQGATTTESGYLLFPFLVGLIFSSIMSGQVVARTGRYKYLIVGALALMTVGLALFSNLRGDTPTLALFSWMLLAGLGVGPTMALFTLIVQNDVPFERLGTATSDLTLIRQIGTSVGLTMAFTLFRNNLSWGLLHDQIVAAGAPAATVPSSPPAGFDMGSFTAVGGGSPLAVLSQVPAQFVPLFTSGFHNAFSIAIANSIWVGVGAAGLSCLTVLVLLHERPLRSHFHAEQHAQSGIHVAALPAGSAKTEPAE
jgi:MFS family permease